MALPLKLTWDAAQTRWKSQIDPVLANPILQGLPLAGVSLVTGTNVINHKLGRALVGWIITDIDAAQTVFSTQASNQTPQLTLNLTASGPCTVSLWVF